MNYEKVIFVDLETSGFLPEIQEIIQVSAIDTVTGDSFNEYVKFKASNANPKALEMNSYNEDIWAEKAISQSRAFYNFQEWLSKRLYYTRTRKDGNEFQTAVLAGHNIEKFDMLFLREWECRFSDKLNIDYVCYDTLQLARWILPELHSHSLESLCNYYEIETKSLHDSLKDTLVNIDVAYRILEEIGRKPKWHPCLISKK